MSLGPVLSGMACLWGDAILAASFISTFNVSTPSSPPPLAVTLAGSDASTLPWRSSSVVALQSVKASPAMVVSLLLERSISTACVRLAKAFAGTEVSARPERARVRRLLRPRKAFSARLARYLLTYSP